jgi:hypothetical protein
MRQRSWNEFAADRPELAAGVRDLLHRTGTALAYLATITKDGGPRINPIAPLIVDGGLYTVLASGPKRDDLIRDRRFALHSSADPDNEDTFSARGQAVRITDPGKAGRIEAAFWAERGRDGRPDEAREQTVFELKLELCSVKRTTGHLDTRPSREIWRANRM